MHARQREVPQIRLGERRHEPARRAVHVHRNIRAPAGRQLVEGSADLGDRLVAAVERRAENGHDTDRVLVQSASASSAVRWKRSPSIGTNRGSTSQ